MFAGNLSWWPFQMSYVLRIGQESPAPWRKCPSRRAVAPREPYGSWMNGDDRWCTSPNILGMNSSWDESTIDYMYTYIHTNIYICMYIYIYIFIYGGFLKGVPLVLIHYCLIFPRKSSILGSPHFGKPPADLFLHPFSIAGLLSLGVTHIAYLPGEKKTKTWNYTWRQAV